MPERPPSRPPSKPPLPKEEAGDEDFVFLKAESKETKSWEKEWNAESIARCKALLKKIGWSVTGDPTSLDPRILDAFDQILREDVVQYGGVKEGLTNENIRVFSLNQTQFVVNRILQGINPGTERDPAFFGSVFERMVEYMEAHPRSK